MFLAEVFGHEGQFFFDLLSRRLGPVPDAKPFTLSMYVDGFCQVKLPGDMGVHWD